MKNGQGILSIQQNLMLNQTFKQKLFITKSPYKNKFKLQLKAAFIENNTRQQSSYINNS